MKQLFQVGEKVIIQTINHPDINGKIGIIRDMLYLDYPIESLYGYIAVKGNYYITDADDSPIHEKSLRKYHPPSTKTFTEIMEELKRPVNETT